MRDREEIIKDSEKADTARMLQIALSEARLEVLLDIRELLIKQ